MKNLLNTSRATAAALGTAFTLATAFLPGPNATLLAQPQFTAAQLANLHAVSPSLIPRVGDFYRLSQLGAPPVPTDPCPSSCPVYLLPDGRSWLVDDSSQPPPPPTDPVAAARSLLTPQPNGAGQRLSPMLDAGPPPIPGGTNSPPPETNYPPVLLDPGSIPINGTFFMLAETWPPFPYCPCPGVDVWLLCDGTYLVDDTGWSWPPPSGDNGGGGTASPHPLYASGDFWLESTGGNRSVAWLTLHGTVAGNAYTILSSLSVNGPWDAELPLTGAANQDFTPFQVSSAGRQRMFFRAQVGTVTPQRLWLESLGIANGYLNILLHGTSDGTYSIVSTTDLRSTNDWSYWSVETNFPGATGQYVTPVSIPLAGRPRLFLAARSWADSTGRGVPDWWMLQYLGSTDADPDALCASGDGWTYRQCYQFGWDPGRFYTPPPPQNVAARMDTTGTKAIITWTSGGGPVTNYVIERGYYGDPGWPFSSIGQVGPSTFTFTDAPPYPITGTTYDSPVYRVRAFFSDGTSAVSQSTPVVTPGLTVNGVVVRGPGGHLYLVVSALPAQVTTLLLFVGNESDGWPGITISASSITNGRVLLPDAEMQELFTYGGPLCLQPFTASGPFGNGTYAGPSLPAEDTREWPSYTFVNAASHSKENLKFLLSSASLYQSFSYYSGVATDGREYSDPVPNLCNDPEGWFARPASSMNYEYYGFHVFSPDLNWSVMQELRPIQENYLWRNFVYDPADFDSSGNWTVGAGLNDVLTDVRSLIYPAYIFTSTNVNSAPLALSLSTHPYSFMRDYSWGSSNDLAEVGITVNTTNIYVAGGVRNVYGLSLRSAVLTTSNPFQPYTLNAGGPAANNQPTWNYFFCDFEAPGLQITNYFFTSQTPYFNYNAPYGTPRPPLPGSPDFTVTNTSPPLITGIGQLFTIAGWAKEVITNGYTGKFGYLEQYFDQACTIDTNGVVTTNSAGLLSPYGEFFPMQPGPAALRTMPDIDPPYQRGTGVVNVIKLQLDVNHDGNMDLSFAGPDNTLWERPFVFWVNNNYDRWATKTVYWQRVVPLYTDTEQDDQETADSPFTPGKATPDYEYRDFNGDRAIPCTRDLEDFARLWVCGITSNMLSSLPDGTAVTLSWGDVGSPNTNNPTIDLWQAADPDGGTGYLTNAVVATNQLNPYLCGCIGRLGPGGSIQLNADVFGNRWRGNYFIWCGVSNGAGALTLTITQGGTNTLAETYTCIQLMDIKQMYERWTVGDDPAKAPTNRAQIVHSDLPPSAPSFQYGPASDPGTPYILHVHGYRLPTWQKDRFAEAEYKRLYWQGYQGRFGSFRWPTTTSFYLRSFDDSETNAWSAGAPLLNLLSNLNTTYPGQVYVTAHSHGAVVAGEALRLAGARQFVNTYVAMQGAIDSHAYDTNTPTRTVAFTTPDRYGQYYTNGAPCYFNGVGGAGTYVTFFNTNDWSFSPTVWQRDQNLKPDSGYGYDYTFTGDWWYQQNLIGRTTLLFPQNTYEIFSYCDQAHAYALGAQPNVRGPFRGSQVDLQSVWPPDTSTTDPSKKYSAHIWHSAEFRSDYASRAGFWNALLGPAGLNLK